MKAVLWAKRADLELMAQVLDRPYLQHVVEQLVQRGVTKIELILPVAHGAAVSLLGDGTRWGIAISHHRAWTDTAAAGDEPVVVGELSCLPHLPALASDSWPALFFHDEDRVSRWTGWAKLPAFRVAEFLEAEEDWRGACRSLGLQMQKVFLEAPSLSIASPKQILLANRNALEGQHPGLFFEGEDRGAGVWVARGVKLPENVTVEAPCYIGEESWIGAGSRLGPHAVVGRQCVVEPGTVICRSVVSEGTYLGKDLEVCDSLVTRNVLHNVRWNAEIQIEEQHVAGALLEGGVSMKWVAMGLIAAVAGAILLVAKAL